MGRKRPKGRLSASETPPPSTRTPRTAASRAASARRAVFPTPSSPRRKTSSPWPAASLSTDAERSASSAWRPTSRTERTRPGAQATGAGCASARSASHAVAGRPIRVPLEEHGHELAERSFEDAAGGDARGVEARDGRSRRSAGADGVEQRAQRVEIGARVGGARGQHLGRLERVRWPPARRRRRGEPQPPVGEHERCVRPEDHVPGLEPPGEEPVLVEPGERLEQLDRELLDFRGCRLGAGVADVGPGREARVPREAQALHPLPEEERPSAAHVRSEPAGEPRVLDPARDADVAGEPLEGGGRHARLGEDGARDAERRVSAATTLNVLAPVDSASVAST